MFAFKESLTFKESGEMRLTVKHDGSRQRKILCAGTTMKMADDNKLLGIEVRIERTWTQMGKGYGNLS